MRKTGFKDPIAPKEEKDIKPQKTNIGFSFTCPDYDERSSCFINAGTQYGVGHRQPVGHDGEPAKEVAVLPHNRRSAHTQKIDETD